MNLIFIFSTPRSGSTLLQRLLATHSGISSVSEPWLLLPFCYALKSEGTFAEYDHGTCQRAITDFIQTLPDRHNDFKNSLSDFALSLYLKSSGGEPIYFLDKTPRYYLIIPEIAKLFPEAKFIFLFRNPLEILASNIQTWSNGKFRIERYYIDLYRGPKLLAQGYKQLREKCTKVHFDELIKSPANTLKAVFQYLDLEFDPSLIENFGKTELKGQFGDKVGYLEYGGIESKPLEKWKGILGTKYRKRFAKKYISKFPVQDLKIFGYDKDVLIKNIDDLEIHGNRHCSDRFDLLLSHIIRICEFPMFIRKTKLSLLGIDSWHVHR